MLFIFIFNIQSIFWGLRSVSGWFQVSLRSHILICRTVDTQFHNPAPVLRNPRCQHQPFNRPPSARPRNTCCPTKQASQSVNLLCPVPIRKPSKIRAKEANVLLYFHYQIQQKQRKSAAIIRKSIRIC